jgi:hypothetical protein
MSLSLDTLWAMLPAHWRVRDAEAAARLVLLTPAEAGELSELDRRALAGEALDRGARERRATLAERAGAGPLRALITVLAEQVAQLEEELDQLADDAFIETCAPWAVPYFADLLGFDLSGVAPPRAEVANAIAQRRRKGTVAVLADGARDLTGLPARAVEEFRRLATTQHLDHQRPGATTATLRGRVADAVRGPDIRSLRRGRGRPHLPHLSVHLWALPLAEFSGAAPVALDATHLLLDPLGRDMPLLARAADGVPTRVTLRAMAADPARFLGSAVMLWRDGVALGPADVTICTLEGPDGAWAPGDPARITLDPERGRLRLPAAPPAGTRLRASFATWGEAPLGAGEFAQPAEPPPAPVLRVPATHPNLAAALAAPALATGGTVEITASGATAAPVAIHCPAQARLVIRAADGRAPVLTPAAPLSITGGDGAEVTLSGFTILGQPVVVPAGGGNRLQRLRLVNCTLVPGLRLRRDGNAASPGTPSLSIGPSETELVLERCITGAIRLGAEAEARLVASIVDAGAATAMAITDLDGVAPAGALRIEGCTIMGRIETREARLVTDSLLLGVATSLRKQRGVARYSWVAPGSALPRRHACLPADGDADPPRPVFVARRFGRPGHLRLHPATDPRIRRGAFDGGEMGAGNAAGLARHLAALEAWLPGFTRLGMVAGSVLRLQGDET